MFNKTLFCVFATSILTFANSLVLSSASAQITPDGTTSTTVNAEGNNVTINGGVRPEGGNNLFHSFQDFSVPTNGSAFFDNAADIANILSRVTGGNSSNIDGLIRANGSASLFLINPAGIIFGENASLDIGGSFYSSTASSILFEDGEFSAVDNLQQPILTINAPIGLSFRDNPGEIVNRSRVENSSGVLTGLEIASGNNLAFVGGDINFESGNATARGGNIYLGGLAEAGIVNLNQDGSLSFPDDLNKGNITLTNAADVDVQGAGGGNIRVDAKNLSLAVGEFGRSLIRGGISSNSTNPQAQAGDVTINVAENIILNDSRITNQVAPGGIGNSGNITVNTGSLQLSNGGDVDATTFGQGNANDVRIDASESISIDGAIARFRSGIAANAQIEDGNGGNIFVSTGNLTIANGGTIEATNFDNIGDDDTPGTGRPGTITIFADSVNLTDARIEATTQFTGEASGIINLNIAEDLTLDNNSFISARAFGDADGGNLSIDARFVVAFSSEGNGNDILASNESGAGGNIEITSQAIFGLQERAIIEGNGTNDIDSSSEFALEQIAIEIPSTEIGEVPDNLVESEQTVAQACQSDRIAESQSGLTIGGKGGIPPEPGLPLDSRNIIVSEKTNPQSTIPAPIETAQGKIQPARGVIVTESGEVILTAYRTNNAGERITQIKPNCS